LKSLLEAGNVVRFEAAAVPPVESALQMVETAEEGR
jgi:hypothetical protein